MAGLAEIKRTRAERIDGWQAPVAYAVGHRTADGWTFPHVNRPGGRHGLPAVLLAEVVGYSGGTQEIDVSEEQLAAAIRAIEPAEAVTEVDHPNLGAWRSIAAAGPTAIAAVFVGSLDDEPAGPADRELRKQL